MFKAKQMIVKDINNIEVKYFRVDREEDSLPFNETDCFEHYRALGYNVFPKYARAIRRNKVDKYTEEARNHKQKIIKSLPKLPNNVKEVFKKYKDGQPDLLIEKDGNWEFIEVKTTSDSLRPNQLIFLEELSKVCKVSIHIFVEIKPSIEENIIAKKVSRRKPKEKKVVASELKLESVISKTTKKVNSHNQEQSIKFIFEKKVFELNKKQIRNTYSKYWTISKLYTLFPKYLLTSNGLEVAAKYTGIKPDIITWYINKQGEAIIKEALEKISKSKQVTKKEEQLINEYKILLKK